ncbi:MAG: hypothetical protein ACRC1T_05555 [Clostridium chrysemydis]|uniref:hypothetical protein n=1 Tax=Clostridium chrysemydis TaxID=2665504 RepID=UPI003F3F1425
MLTNKTIELINKALELAVCNSQIDEIKQGYKNALSEFREYICDIEDMRDSWEE